MNSKELYDEALAQADRGEFDNAKKLLNQVVDDYPNTPESEDALIGLVELDKMVKRRNMNKATTISLVILGPIVLGVVLMATGTPPGVVGFFIFLPMVVILPILGVSLLISAAMKSRGSKNTESNSSMEKDKTKDEI
jgi:hypothetical protein